MVKDFAAIHFLEQDVAGEIQYLKYVGMLVSCWLDPLVTSTCLVDSILMPPRSHVLLITNNLCQSHPKKLVVQSSSLLDFLWSNEDFGGKQPPNSFARFRSAPCSTEDIVGPSWGAMWSSGPGSKSMLTWPEHGGNPAEIRARPASLIDFCKQN